MPKENSLDHLVRQLTRSPGSSTAGGNPAHSSRIQKYMLERSENQDAHVSYQEEQILLNLIRTGDLEALQESSAKGSPEDLQRLGRMSDSPLKQLEYACCSFVTLATRAAVEGGLDADTAYSISDVYLQRLAKCQTPGPYPEPPGRGQVRLRQSRPRRPPGKDPDFLPGAGQKLHRHPSEPGVHPERHGKGNRRQPLLPLPEIQGI